ncbi:hypothetical protein JCM10213_002321 [Rhodosporidiobolus nylandii]
MSSCSSSSALDRPASLQVPVPVVPDSSIPRLIVWGALVTYLLPHSGFDLGNGVSFTSSPSPSSPPKWTLQLESWYRCFCAHVWPLLKADQDKDNEVCAGLTLYRAKRRKAGAGQEELDLLWRDLRLLVNRTYDRYAKLYGLHAGRKRYLDYHLAAAAKPTTEAEILRATPTGDLDLFCGHAAGSVWPLLAPHPPTPTGRCTCRFSASSEPAAQQVFGVPEKPTAETRALSIRVWGEDVYEPPDMGGEVAEDVKAEATKPQAEAQEGKAVAAAKAKAKAD